MLTEKQQRFVEEYLVDLNAAAAYQRAGYAATGAAARTNASRLLTNANVISAIAAARTAQSERLGIQSDDILRECDLIAHSDIGDILDFSGDKPAMKPANQIAERARRCISSIKVKRKTGGRGRTAQTVEIIEFKLWDKLSALDKLGRHKRLFVEAHEHSGSVLIQTVAGLDPTEVIPSVLTPASVPKV